MWRRLRIVFSFTHDTQVAAMKSKILILVSASVIGCANSGVVPTGPDAYMIAKSEWGFTSGAVHEARLLREASEYCKSIGKQILATSTNNNDVTFGKTPAAEVHFRCLPTSGAEPSPAEVQRKE
jgi:hypothetical protein